MTQAGRRQAGPGDQGQLAPPYGMQAQHTWGPGEGDSRPLLDESPNGELWQLAVFGDVLLTIAWGTSSRRQIVVDAPAVATLPGNVSIFGLPRDPVVGAQASVTLTRATAARPAELRRLLSTAAPLALPVEAVRFVALAASTVTIRGTAVALAIGQSIPLVSSSVLTVGTGYVEYDP